MNSLTWKTNRKITHKGYAVPVAENLEEYPGYPFIRKDSKKSALIKKLFWAPLRIFSDVFVDGYIHKDIGRWMKMELEDGTQFLDIGCGNMKLKHYLNGKLMYNAIDISFSEFHLNREFPEDDSNICIASAKDIPLESNSVSLIATTECLQHIIDVEEAFKEIHRICKPGATIIVSNSNQYAYKYEKKGEHQDNVNSWTYSGFIEDMEKNGFELVESYMKGYWVPLPTWLTKISFHTPKTSAEEKYNTNFFYKFKAVK